MPCAVAVSALAALAYAEAGQPINQSIVPMGQLARLVASEF